ncbi:hypothetical protein GGS20DRAFT_78862 [Poronia punctata]|nr:hypothetical protein GGS20DRAFT_78862 [Poronia punctata]
MATIARQPFAPLSEARLHALTSLKNRQNAVPNSPVGKRKASDVAGSDDENIAPTLSSKRAKGADNSSSKDSLMKPPSFMLTKSVTTNDLATISPHKKAATHSRSILSPKSPVSKVNTSTTRPSPLSAPAGRSPPRGKRSGILSSRRRTGGSIARVDPPVFQLPSSSSAAPFSLDAALKGTISNYASRSDVALSKPTTSGSSDFGSLHEPEMKSSWFFDIHEDTPEQEMTNLLQHGTCILDISSDEENETRRERERAEGKENVPPLDDISQTSRPRAARRVTNADDMMVEKARNPLGEMDPKEYYSQGHDENSVVIVHDDEDETVDNDFHFSSEPSQPNVPEVSSDVVPEAESDNSDNAVEGVPLSVEQLMGENAVPEPVAASLQPIEGTDESFEFWESSSAKDEAEERPEAEATAQATTEC